MDQFYNMKIIIYDTSFLNTNQICISFEVSADGSSRVFHSYLDLVKIKNKDRLAIIDKAWDNIYKDKIVDWLGSIRILQDLAQLKGFSC